MLPLILGALWVIAAAMTAMLPMRFQTVPGLSLLISAPLLLVWIGLTHGFLWVACGLFALFSMFRRPINYLIRKALGLPLPDLPPDLRRSRAELAGTEQPSPDTSASLR